MILIDTSYLVYITISAIIFIFWYLRKHFNYWTERGLKGPKPTIIIGNYFDQALRPTHELDLQWHNQYGKVYGVFNGNKPVLRIADPELIKIITIRDFNLFVNRRKLNTFHPILNITLFHARDRDWKKYRTLMSPTFTSGKMKRMYPMIKDCLNTFISHLNTYAESGAELNINNLTENFTMDVIASCVFATKTNANQEPNNPVVINGKKVFEFKPKLFIPAAIFPLVVNNFFNIEYHLDMNANQFFFDLTRNIIQNRRNTDVKYNDFIQLMMNASVNDSENQDELDDMEAHLNDENENNYAEQKFVNNKSDVKSLSENEILAQAWILFVAGFETSATTLAFCKYELALNPDCQEILYKEVYEAVHPNSDISYENLLKLPYLDAVISETLRKYPPLMRIDREVSINDYELENTGIKLYKGQLVEIMIYALHHCEEYFPNPEKFIPERFLPENRHQLIPYTYMPFGFGPRNCIGMRFALLELKLALFHIIRRFKFVRTSNTEIPLRLKRFTPMCEAESIQIGIESRFKFHS